MLRRAIYEAIFIIGVVIALWVGLTFDFHRLAQINSSAAPTIRR
jgi:hypothetical protein